MLNSAPSARPPAGPDLATVPIRSLLPADSPRSSGENKAHTVRLAECYGVLPPILVHRGTMRVIDGMHRLRAAEINGHKEITVEFFDGNDEDAFARGVQLNVAHGLPLSLADRKAAAARILSAQPYLSDRAIALTAGLSGKTVAAIRSLSTAENAHSDRRLGSDGRVRPVNAAEGRRRAAEVLAHSPERSLREVAASVGVSRSTVRDVRRRLQRAEGKTQNGSREPEAAEPSLPQMAPQRRRPRNTQHTNTGHGSSDPRDVILPKLAKDPSLRFTEGGRGLLRWLNGHVIGKNDWSGLVDSVPEHCVPSVADLARRTAAAWNDLASQLEQRATDQD